MKAYRKALQLKLVVFSPNYIKWVNHSRRNQLVLNGRVVIVWTSHHEQLFSKMRQNSQIRTLWHQEVLCTPQLLEVSGRRGCQFSKLINYVWVLIYHQLYRDKNNLWQKISTSDAKLSLFSYTSCEIGNNPWHYCRRDSNGPTYD